MNDISRCSRCSKLFLRSWTDQKACEACQPLEINPDTEKILDRLSSFRF